MPNSFFIQYDEWTGDLEFSTYFNLITQEEGRRVFTSSKCINYRPVYFCRWSRTIYLFSETKRELFCRRLNQKSFVCCLKILTPFFCKFLLWSFNQGLKRFNQGLAYYYTSGKNSKWYIKGCCPKAINIYFNAFF